MIRKYLSIGIMLGFCVFGTLSFTPIEIPRVINIIISILGMLGGIVLNIQGEIKNG